MSSDAPAHSPLPEGPADPPDFDAPLAELERRLETLAAQSRLHSHARLAAFLGIVAGLVALLESVAVATGISLTCLAAFVVLLFRHDRIERRATLLGQLALLAGEARVRRSSRRASRTVPTPSDSSRPLLQGLRVFRDEPESLALDAGVLEDLAVLEGPRSLFGFLDVSSTELGARRLRRMLERPLRRVADIRARQEVVRELAGNDERRRRLLGALVRMRGRRLGPAIEFLHSGEVFGDRLLIVLLAHVLGTICFATLVAAFVQPALIAVCILLCILDIAVIGSNVRRANPLRERLLAFGPVLDAVIAIDDLLRDAPLESPEGAELAAVLSGVAPQARRLASRLSILRLHEFGLVFEAINVVALVELRVLPPSERLFRDSAAALERALGAIAELEALLSLACPLAEQDGFCMPEALEAAAPRLEGEGLGHPLIESDRVVRNGIALGDGDNVRIVTGSNMAGKSTYLKAIGTTIVLAAAGAPVCAERFCWTPVELYSDINIRDSLDDGKSYFQVEVERVRDVLRAAERGPLVLAIFDELFRGTNSAERLAISRAIVRHLRDRGILLLVATHDLALTKLAEGEDGRCIRNLHLRERVEEGTMTFDYIVREGPAPSRNAIRVLEVSGYAPEIIAAARADVAEGG